MQSLGRVLKGTGEKSDGAIKETKAVPKKVVEYVVLQKRLIQGKEDQWKVWGTTEETKPEDVLREKSAPYPRAVAK